jgi:hypothetical protein
MEKVQQSASSILRSVSPVVATSHKTTQVQSANAQLFNCSNHKQLHVSAVRMFQKSKIGELHSKTFHSCCYTTSSFTFLKHPDCRTVAM